MSKRIGWIGLGKMGQPMAMNLQKAGFDLTVWNRSAPKSDALRAAGAQVGADVAQVAELADVLFISVAGDDALRHVVLGADGALDHMRKGSVLIETSTVSIAVSGDVASAADARGLHYLRAPVSGSVALATAGTLTILVSGSSQALETVRPILEAVSAKQIHVGDAEQARVLKLAINMMLGATAVMMGEATALCLKNGMDRSTMLDAIGASVVASPLIGYKIDALKARDYSPNFSASQMAKDYDLVFQASMGSHTPMPMAAIVREYWNALIAAGDGDEDFFKIAELAARSAGIDDV